MYAGTIIEYVDLSEIPSLGQVTEQKPFFMTAFSSEKGTEDPITIDEAKDFYKMFVTPDASQSTGYNISFEKHGQPLLQAAHIMDSGGKIYCKRVVAEDAELANMTIYANVKAIRKQESIGGLLQYWSTNVLGEKVKVSDATNSDGEPNEPVMINVAQIYYSAESVSNIKSIDALTALNAPKVSKIYSYIVGDEGLEANDYAIKTADGKYYKFTLGTPLTKGAKITWESISEDVVFITADDVQSTTQIRITANTEGITVLDCSVLSRFPILIVTDNGRGVSKKKFRIVPNYEYSKDLDIMLYNFQVIEEGSVLDNRIVCLDSEKKYLSSNVSVKNQFNYKLSQIKTEFIDARFNEFIDAIAEATGMTHDEVISIDVINGTNRKGEAISALEIMEDSFDLQYVYGILLQNGSNGSFGDKPYGSEDYTEQLVNFFNGTVTDEIYDVDNLKINFIVDACYPAEVKTAIENFVMFREDCFFFCDFGTSISNYLDVLNITNNQRKADSKFVAYYHNSWEMIDPYTEKQIPVTICYDLAALLVTHYKNGIVRPLAGQLHGITFPNAIEGTVNFIPKLVPGLNQKQQMNDLRVNYVSYYDGVLTLDSEYTSQKKHTQFSYINNILATQEVIQAIRTRCPKIRYSFIDTEGLTKYKEDVQSTVLDKFSSNFSTLELVYLGDSTYEHNKIFYAGINVRFKDFAQTEMFKVYALL